jgi:molybdate transport system substrate-binding protein
MSGSRGEVVFAASSLQDAFKKLAEDLKSQGINVTFNFAGSQALATQLAQGAQADVFASADDVQMQAAIAAGAVVSGTQQVLATNELALIVPVNDAKVKALADLTKRGVKIVIADETVPAGKYTLQLLRRMSADSSGYGAQFQRQVLENVVSRETNVRQVVAKIELGEADAGFVYMTDARSAKVSMVSTEGFNVTAQYYVAPVRGGQSLNPNGGKKFIAYVLSPEGQKVLQSFGFGPPPK